MKALYAPVAQLDRVTGYEPVGRGFESLPAYQKTCKALLPPDRGNNGGGKTRLVFIHQPGFPLAYNWE